MIHPIIGHIDEVEAFKSALQSKRFHHAWLFEGPKGIGKASLARMLAAHLLGADIKSTSKGVSVVEDKTTSLMAAGSHPDYRYISREADEKGKLPQDIPVSSMRSLVQFFSLKPALGGRRVAIIDSLDELNASGANALLKTLEEPPKDCVLLLIYHQGKHLLPTIRSRCQRLRFASLNEDEMRTATSMQQEDIVLSDEIMALSNGSIGQALTFAQAETEALISILKAIQEQPHTLLQASTGNRLMGEMARNEINFDLAIRFLQTWLFQRDSELLDASCAGVCSKSWQKVLKAVGTQRSLNLDLTESAAQCLSLLQDMEREIELQNAV